MDQPDDECIKLTTLAEPTLEMRSVLICDHHDDPALMLSGSYAQAPPMACACGTVLVRGMFTSQFVVGMEELAKSPNPNGSYSVSASQKPNLLKTIPLWLGTLTVVSENGLLILRCPKCSVYSEVGVPRGGP